MTEQDFILVIEALLCAALLVWFFSRPWQSLWTAVSRQHLFELRDQMFDIAASQRIDFSDTAYCQLREYLNGCIRFAHKITFGSLVAGAICLGPEIQKKYNLQETIESIPDEKVRQEMRDIFQKSAFILLRHMVIRSPLVWMLLCFSPFIVISNKIFELVDSVASQLRDLILAQTDLDHTSLPLHSTAPIKSL